MSSDFTHPHMRVRTLDFIVTTLLDLNDCGHCRPLSSLPSLSVYSMDLPLRRLARSVLLLVLAS